MPPPRLRPLGPPCVPSGGQEVVHGLDEVDALGGIRVPGRVLADAPLERAALAPLALLDVPDLPGDAGQVARRRLATPPVVVLGGAEAGLLAGRRLDPRQEPLPVGDVVPLAHDRRAEVPVVVPV